jgi:hypothetical protein
LARFHGHRKNLHVDRLIVSTFAKYDVAWNWCFRTSRWGWFSSGIAVWNGHGSVERKILSYIWLPSLPTIWLRAKKRGEITTHFELTSNVPHPMQRPVLLVPRSSIVWSISNNVLPRVVRKLKLKPRSKPWPIKFHKVSKMPGSAKAAQPILRRHPLARTGAVDFTLPRSFSYHSYLFLPFACSRCIICVYLLCISTTHQMYINGKYCSQKLINFMIQLYFNF